MNRRSFIATLALVTTAGTELAGRSPRAYGSSGAVGEWSTISKNTVSDVPLPFPTQGNRNGFMKAWSGGDFDARSRQLFCLGGGDADYDGNEVMAFHVDTGLWSLFWGNTPGPNPNLGMLAYPDGSPASRHTYSGITVVPTWGTAGGLFLWGGLIFHTVSVGSVFGGPDCWMLDLATKRWQRFPDAKNPGAGATGCCTDGRFLYLVTLRDLERLDLRNVAAGWVVFGSAIVQGSEISHSLVYHPVTKKLYAAGDRVLNPPVVIDPVTGTTRRLRGSSAWVGLQGPLLAADPAAALLYTYDGSTVWQVDAVTGAAVSLGAGGQTPTALNGQGTYGRGRLDPATRRLILVNNVDEPVFAYQLPDAPR
jgi:hypothetical protein